MYVAGEILIDHPTKTLADQVNQLYVRKAIGAVDTKSLMRTVQEERHQLDNPTMAALLLDLDDGRTVRLRKYTPPSGAGQRVRIEKADLTPQQEIEARVKALQQTTGIAYDKALGQVAKDDLDLWQDYVAAQRAGHGSVPAVAKAAPASPAVIHKMAETRMAQQPGLTKLQALADLVQEHGGAKPFLDCYRAYQLGEGLDDHLQRVTHTGGAHRG